MKRWIFLFLINVVFVCVAYWVYETYLEEPENKISRIVNHTSIRVSKALAYEMEDPAKKSKLEIADFFSNLEKYLAEVNKDVSELQKIRLLNMSQKQMLHDATIYVQSSREVLKAEYDKYIKWQDYSEALKTIRIGEIEVAAKEDINSKKTEYEIAKEEFKKALGKLLEAYNLTARSIGEERLADRQLIKMGSDLKIENSWNLSP
jgi:hypothetical protein